jgi:hypothetical protein
MYMSVQYLLLSTRFFSFRLFPKATFSVKRYRIHYREDDSLRLRRPCKHFLYLLSLFLLTSSCLDAPSFESL